MSSHTESKNCSKDNKNIFAFQPSKNILKGITIFLSIGLIGSTICMSLIFVHRDVHQYPKNISSEFIIENSHALVPDRIVYKNSFDEYYIFTESDSNFNNIYNNVTHGLNYVNTGRTLSLEEIEDLKENYTFLEFDYNTKSKNRIFLLNCPDIAMINMTGEQGQVAREKIKELENISPTLASASSSKESFSTFYDLESEKTIKDFPKIMKYTPEKISGVRYKQIDKDELEELIHEYSLNIDISKVDFEKQNVIVTFYNREKISKLDKCIGHLSYYFSNTTKGNHLNVQIISKIYNANCIYCYENYSEQNTSIIYEDQSNYPISTVIDDSLMYLND